MAKKVVVAMSGGIDSSVAAALLKRAGFNVAGVFMKFWSDPGLKGVANRCCSPEAEKRAAWVAKSLAIPFCVLNFEKEFKKKVVDYFLDGYKKGITPNPCVACNKEIKFGLLLKTALKLDADFVATGHYARKREVKSQKSKVKSYHLLKAKDREKDQSYFLWQLNQKQLKHILFPAGGYTKSQVRNLAKKFRLPVFDIAESMEICFVPDSNISEFLKSRIKTNKGKIVDMGGKTVGQHQGLWRYTIGQRKGIGLAGGPYYVLDKDLEKNLLIVTKNEKDLFKKELVAKNVNWISGRVPKLPLKVKAKIRYRQQPALATIKKLKAKSQKPKVVNIIFDRPQRAITAGQSVVFYRGQELLAGGIICNKKA